MPHSKSLSILFAILFLVAPLASVAGADGGLSPNHNITDVVIRADASNVYFDVTVEGVVEDPVQDVTHFRIDFGVQSAEEAALGSPAAQGYFVDYGSKSTPEPYFLYRKYGTFGLGSPLADQPASGVSTVTFTIPRAELTTLTGSAATSGTALVDLTFQYQVNATTVDTYVAGDFVIPVAGDPNAVTLHLAGQGVQPFVSRSLDTEAPAAQEPRVDVVVLDDAGGVRFVGEPEPRPFDIQSAQANLWMSFTSTTPVIALNFVDVRVLAIHPDGRQELIGQRAEYVDGSNPNVFTTPAKPQLMQFPLKFTKAHVPAGVKLALDVTAPGILGLGDNGPALLYYGSQIFDSTLRVTRAVGDEPIVPVTDPVLGILPFHLRGASGDLSLEAPEGTMPDAVPASSADVTPAVWETPAFASDFTFESARVDVWVSPTTTSPALSLNFLDARLYVVDGGEENLVARRPEYTNPEANPNVFTTPLAPQRFSWTLDANETLVPAGASLRLKIVADTFTDMTPGAALVYSNAAGADSVLTLKTQSVTLDAAPSPAAPGENVTFSGTIGGGVPPYTYHFDFGDGTATAPASTEGGAVNATHAYAAAGVYTATLVAVDSLGRAGGGSADVAVSDSDTAIEFTDVTANPYLPVLGNVEVTWRTNVAGNSTVHYGVSPGPFTDSVTVAETTLDHAVMLTGLQPGTEYVYAVETAGAVSRNHTFTTPADFTGDSVVVVAVVDTGINPYHERFSRPGRTAHPATYIDGFPAGAEPLVLNLDAPDYASAMQADSDIWGALQAGKLYWIPGTNIIGAYDSDASSGITGGSDNTPILDEHGHGTATAGTVVHANPDVLIVASEGLDAKWALEQPWIDVVSMSYGGPAFGPVFGADASFQAAVDAGKLLVTAAGNQPNPHFTHRPTGYPSVISVGGAHSSEKSEELFASKFPDVVSDFTIGGLPTHASLNGTDTMSGTSFATPRVAGTLSAAVLALREQVGQTTEGTRDGLVVGNGTGFLADGALTNVEMRDAMNRTAVYWETTDWSGFFSAPVNPVAPWLQMGWGYVGPELAPAMAAAATAENPPEKPELAQRYMAAKHDAERRYHAGIYQAVSGCGGGDCDTFLQDVDLPGARFDVRQLDTPIETSHPYPQSATMEWTVTVPGADAVSLHFEDFSVETGWDYVELLTGDGVPVSILSADGGASFWSAYVPGDTVIVRLVTDGGVERHGFLVQEVDVFTA